MEFCTQKGIFGKYLEIMNFQQNNKRFYFKNFISLGALVSGSLV